MKNLFSLRSSAQHLPQGIWLLFALYFVASFTHFTHNAEYIAYYPNMPRWITRETVYWTWLGVCSLGLLGWLASRFGYLVVGMLFIAAYGAMGLDGLLHYTLALCSEHSWAANLTIWFEVLTGLLLAMVCVLWLSRRLMQLFKPAPLS